MSHLIHHKYHILTPQGEPGPQNLVLSAGRPATNHKNGVTATVLVVPSIQMHPYITANMYPHCATEHNLVTLQLRRRNQHGFVARLELNWAGHISFDNSEGEKL